MRNTDLLLMRLLTLEAEQMGFLGHVSMVVWQITASDDGEDAHIKWEGGQNHTEWGYRTGTRYFSVRPRTPARRSARRKFSSQTAEHQRARVERGAIGWRSLHPLSARLHATKRCQMRVKPYGEVCEGMGKPMPRR